MVPRVQAMSIQERKSVITSILEVEHCSDAGLGLAEVKYAAILTVFDGNYIGRFRLTLGDEGNGCQVDVKNNRSEDAALFDTQFDRKWLRDQSSSN